MSNRTLIPALSAKVGDWKYYICVMKYAQVTKEIQFAYELGGNSDLNSLIQRGISTRTKDIVDYLLNSQHRFLGALIVAVWGGNPNFISVEMENDEGLLNGLDNAFGVLTFDGSQQYFALDGQHRLRAIKDALKRNPELGNEEICVLLVSHYETPEGKERTRRLFTNINRYAKTTTKGENIALDEDDGFSIVSRRLINEHPFLKEDGRVIVFTRNDQEGEIKIAAGTIPNGNKRAFTTITTLYEMIKDIGHELDISMNLSHRPSDDVLEDSYNLISSRFDDLIKNCGNIPSKFLKTQSAKDIRCPKDKEAEGHPFMRSIVQRAVTRCVSKIIERGSIGWEEIMSRLNSLDWRLAAAPWVSVVSMNNNKVKMLTGRDYVSLLDELLLVHIAPSSKSEIRRAISNYKRIKNNSYPLKDEYLFINLPSENDQEVSETVEAKDVKI
ncbi:MAG: DNA sulfur modification protein DndB [Thermodesulfobacteriota bacterium]